jgi:hypothetical protein
MALTQIAQVTIQKICRCGCAKKITPSADGAYLNRPCRIRQEFSTKFFQETTFSHVNRNTSKNEPKQRDTICFYDVRRLFVFLLVYR